MPQATLLRTVRAWLIRVGPGRTARALCVVVSAGLLLCGVILALAAPAAQALAGRYLAVMQAPGGHCPGDPIPAPDGCWSLAHGTFQGVGTAAGAAEMHLVGPAGTRLAVRLATLDDVGALPKPGSVLGLHLWGQDVTAIEVAAAKPGAAPRYLLTQANPFYRLGATPTGGGSVVMLGLLGLALAMALGGPTPAPPPNPDGTIPGGPGWNIRPTGA